MASRRASVKSNDTGYESLGQEDSWEGMSPNIASELGDLPARQAA
jgi:hypothetical protein